MENQKYDLETVRALIDRYFSIEWCRDKGVVPVSLYIKRRRMGKFKKRSKFKH